MAVRVGSPRVVCAILLLTCFFGTLPSTANATVLSQPTENNALSPLVPPPSPPPPFFSASCTGTPDLVIIGTHLGSVKTSSSIGCCNFCSAFNLGAKLCAGWFYHQPSKGCQVFNEIEMEVLVKGKGAFGGRA